MVTSKELRHVGNKNFPMLFSFFSLLLLLLKRNLLGIRDLVDLSRYFPSIENCAYYSPFFFKLIKAQTGFVYTKKIFFLFSFIFLAFFHTIYLEELREILLTDFQILQWGISSFNATNDCQIDIFSLEQESISLKEQIDVKNREIEDSRKKNPFLEFAFAFLCFTVIYLYFWCLAKLRSLQVNFVGV